MSNGSEMQGKNEQEKRGVNKQERRDEDGDGDIIMIGGREVDSKEENEEKGKSDGSVTVKIPLEGGMIEEMSFGISEEAWVWLGDLPTKFGWKWGMKELKKMVTNLENGEKAMNYQMKSFDKFWLKQLNLSLQTCLDSRRNCDNYGK